MRATANGVVGQRLLVAKRQFELWRRGCRGPGRIPTELWVLAADAAEELGIEEAARQLQFPAERLRQWVEQLGLSGGARKPVGPEFVELSPLPWGPPGECQVEIAKPSARKLCILAEELGRGRVESRAFDAIRSASGLAVSHGCYERTATCASVVSSTMLTTRRLPSACR
jgi:hypothetical protein